MVEAPNSGELASCLAWLYNHIWSSVKTSQIRSAKQDQQYTACWLLKRGGVKKGMLAQFSCPRINSIFTYAAAAWFRYVTKQSKELKSDIRAFKRLTLPSIDSYTSKLGRLGPPRLAFCLHNIGRSYADRTGADPDHRQSTTVYS